MKLHRHVALVRTNDGVLTEELLARRSFAQRVAGRLSDTVLLVVPAEESALLDELRRIGHAPRVVR